MKIWPFFLHKKVRTCPLACLNFFISKKRPSFHSRFTLPTELFGLVKYFLRFLPSLVILVTFLTDRFSKEWIQRILILGESVPVLHFFNLTYLKNTGIAFGMGQNRNEIFIFASSAILFFLVILLRSWDRSNTVGVRDKISLALVIGGAVGNLYDRIAYGSVVDFLDFYAGSYHWPSFNVADSAICAGAFLLAVFSWKKGGSPVVPL